MAGDGAVIPEPTLLAGDCFEVLQTLEPDSVDSCVTDPPYGLSFMGKHWDKGVPDADIWREVYRVLKPGAHLLSFFGTRTYHRGAVAIEDAGFEIRDQIGWLYASGFPKSLDVSKAIDKARTEDAEPVRVVCRALRAEMDHAGLKSRDLVESSAGHRQHGWGTALKPAWEPIVVARKPLEGTVAANVLKWGTGGLNVDSCRVPASAGDEPLRWEHGRSMDFHGAADRGPCEALTSPGRWPANVIHDGSDEVLAEFAKYGESVSKSGMRGTMGRSPFSEIDGSGRNPDTNSLRGHADTGTAARFFYTAKASKDDRNDGLWDYEHTDAADMVDREPDSAGMNSPRAGAGRPSGARNHHPTVKPTSLMRYLVRLVTPKGGLVLDPFAGSGTTLIAAYREDCRAIGIELDPDYHKMASHRIERATAQLRLPL